MSDHQLEDETEISCKEALFNLMDESFQDVKLQGNDGGIVGANRALLGARSVVFRRMLFGDYSEAKSPVVTIGFSTAVLRLLLEYIHTDSCRVFMTSEEVAFKEVSLKETQTIVTLIEAAMYFQFPGLGRKAQAFLLDLVERNPSNAFVVLEGCIQAGPVATQMLRNGAVKAVALKLVEDEVIVNNLKILSSPALKAVLEHADRELLSDKKKFDTIIKWSNEVEDVQSIEHRRREAKKLIQHVSFEWIDPNYLKTTVSESGLVSNSEIAEALETQAQALKEQPSLYNLIMGKLPGWKLVDQFDNLRVLNIPPVKDRILRWSIKVNAIDKHLCLGVSSDRGTNFIGYTTKKGRLVYCAEKGTSVVFHNHKALKFEIGSKIVFQLDLHENSLENGNISASVDGGPRLIVASGLKPVSGDQGLVPAMRRDKGENAVLLSLENL